MRSATNLSIDPDGYVICDSNSTGWHSQRRLLDQVPQRGFLVSNAYCRTLNSLNLFGPCASFVPVIPIHLQLWRLECDLAVSQMFDSSQLAELPWSDRSTERLVSSGRRSTSPLIASSEMRRLMCDAESFPSKIGPIFCPGHGFNGYPGYAPGGVSPDRGICGRSPGPWVCFNEAKVKPQKAKGFGGSEILGWSSEWITKLGSFVNSWSSSFVGPDLQDSGCHANIGCLKRWPNLWDFVPWYKTVS